jgi:D-xylose transport system substrate-binding protein
MVTRVCLIALLALAGCKRPESSAAKKVALLLPESKTARYETRDRPLFEKRLKASCPECELFYGNANQDAARQQSQAEAALTNGARVLVLDPVDGAAAKVIAEKAKAMGAWVISYDRLVLGTDAVDYFVGFEAEGIGRLQAQGLLAVLGERALPALPAIVMINGAPTDNNAVLLKRGAHAVLDGKVRVLKEYDTPDWSPDKAQQQMTQALTALGDVKLDGVYAANDGTAGGAIAALKAAGGPLPPVTGLDAEAAAIQRLVAGEQYLTVFNPIALEADAAAELAVGLLAGKPLPPGKTSVDNGARKVPATVLPPTAVTRTNLKDTVFKEGLWTREQICTAAYEEACKAAGL